MSNQKKSEMNSIIKKMFIPVLGLIFIVFAGCKSTQNTSDSLKLDSLEAKAAISNSHPNIAELFSTSVGYAIFPNVGKGAYVIGAASGNGTVYQNGKLTGYSNLKQLDVGLQIGGKAFIEVIFFQTQAALNHFKQGNFELAANVSAVILEEGVSKSVDFRDGFGVVTKPKAGAMAGISVGGQKFEFFPAQ
jgi:lipid-binding SYLF domain-containing protein